MSEIATPDGELRCSITPPAASVCVRWPVEARNDCAGDFASIDAQNVANADRVVWSGVVRHLDWSYQLVVTKEIYRFGKSLTLIDARRLINETRDEWQASGSVGLIASEPEQAPKSEAFVASIDSPTSHDRLYVVASGKDVYLLAFHLPNDAVHAEDVNTEAAEVMRSLVVIPPVAGAAEVVVVDLGWWMLRAAGLVVLIITVGVFVMVRRARKATISQ